MSLPQDGLRKKDAQLSDAAYTDETWQSEDGLTLHYRDYAGRDDRPPILCIPGLTRNARDFEPVIEAFAGEWRMLCVNLRGRGKSEYAKDSSSYTPFHYMGDLIALLDLLKLEKVAVIGTSLGGIVTMLMGQNHSDRIAGAVINDIGPEIEQSGLDRIMDYVGQGRSYPTWMHAAWALKESSGDIYPEYETADWLRFAKRMMCVSGNGRITLDYDMKIAEPFANPPAKPFDMWPTYKALEGRPLLVLRGGLSDLLSEDVFGRMGDAIEGVELATVPNVGHPPTLEEPASLEAIAKLLGRIA